MTEYRKCVIQMERVGTRIKAQVRCKEVSFHNTIFQQIAYITPPVAVGDILSFDRDEQRWEVVKVGEIVFHPKMAPLADSSTAANTSSGDSLSG